MALSFLKTVKQKAWFIWCKTFLVLPESTPIQWTAFCSQDHLKHGHWPPYWARTRQKSCGPLRFYCSLGTSHGAPYLVATDCMWESIPWIEFLMALLHSGKTSDGSKLVAVWLRELQVEMPLSCLWNGLKALRKGGGLQVCSLIAAVAIDYF